MKQRMKARRSEASARNALRRRVMQWYSRFNAGRSSDCFALVDPRLTAAGKVNEPAYAQSLDRFRDLYGQIHPWHVRISLHLSGSGPATDPRPFAYVYTVWQDERREFHMFRERWVLEGDCWYSRVAGLVANKAA